MSNIRGGSEYDEIQDELLKLWPLLDSTEQERFNGLSADLYMLSENEVFEKATEDERAQAQMGPKMEAAWKAREWDQVLMLLRKGPSYIDKASVAWARSRCYENMGLPDVGLLFLDFAYKINSSHDNYAIFALNALLKLGRDEEAKRRAENFISNPNTSDLLLFESANILFSCARKLSITEAAPVYKEVERVIRRTLSHLAHSKTRAMEKNVLFAHYTLGQCYEKLNLIDDALVAYTDALKIQPCYDAALIAIAFLKYESDRTHALELFERAIKSESKSVWPYFYLAHDALLKKNYKRGLELCEKALGLNASDSVQADLFEWSAIARVGLKESLDTITVNFERAVEMAPFNSRIRGNFNLLTSPDPQSHSKFIIENDVAPVEARAELQVA